MHRGKEEVILILFPHFSGVRQAEHVEITIARLSTKPWRRGSFEELGETHRNLLQRRPTVRRPMQRCARAANMGRPR
jgi:hypothetical protein